MATALLVELNRKATSFGATNSRLYLRAHWSHIDGKPDTYNPAAHDATHDTHNDGRYLALTAKAADSEKLDGLDSTSFGVSFGDRTNTATTTAAFITLLDSWGMFGYKHAFCKFTWSYAGNADITDIATSGSVEIAGAICETWVGSDATKMIRLICPNTGSGNAYREFIYNDQGSSYSPGWREVWNSRTLTNLNQLTNGPGYITANHTHGNITSDGKITTAITKAAGDYLVISDTSDGGKLGVGIVLGSADGTYLDRAGNWSAPSVADDAITNAKLDNMPAYTIKAQTSTAGNPQDVSWTNFLDLVGSTYDRLTVTAAEKATWNAKLGPSDKAADTALFDGIGSTRFIYGKNSSGSNTLNATQNVYEEPQYKSGFWEVTGAAFMPDTEWYWGLTTAHTSNNASYNYSGQMAFKNGSGGDAVYLRGINGGTPTDWRKILTDGNVIGGATTILADNLTASRALISNASGKVAVSSVTSTQLGYLVGVTSAIQTQLNNKSNTDHTHTFASLTSKPTTIADFGITDFQSRNSSSALNPANTTVNAIGYANSISLFGQSDGGLYVSAYSSAWQHQIFGDFRTGQIAIRGNNSGTWQPWRTVWDSSNLTSVNQLFSGQLAVTTHVADADAYSLELNAPDGTIGEISLRFHQSNKFYNQIRSTSAGFKFTQGHNATTMPVTALRFISEQATGTAPFTVASTTLVTNLNADYLEGQHGSYYDHRAYTDNTNYLGGYYTSGGLEKPNNAAFGSGKLKVAMLGGSNLGFGGTYNDVLWISTYSGGDVKSSHALVFDKYSSDVYVSDQDFDSASWGTGHKLWHSGNDGSGSGLDADMLDGYHISTSATANTVVVRDANNYIYANYINSNRGNESSAAESYIYDSGDGWMRKKTVANVKTELFTSATFTGTTTIAGLLSGSSLTTGNSQILNATSSIIYFGNPNTPIVHEGTTHTFNASGLADFAIGDVSGKNRIQSYASGVPIRFLNSANGYSNIAVDDVYLDGANSLQATLDALNTGIYSYAGTAYTPTLSQKDIMIRCTSVIGNVAITLPPNSSVAFPVGTEIHIAHMSAYEITIAYGSGVSIYSEGSTSANAGKRRINARNQVVTAKKISTDTWLLFGALKS